MDFRILGPLEVVGPDGPIRIDAGKVRALLELLLLHANEVIAGERLVDSLWGDFPSDSAEHAIEVYVSRLRRALGADRIETHPPGYRIRVEPGELDLHRFEALTAEARESFDADDAAKAVRLFQDADALWRGPALAELRSSERARAEVTRLDELRLAETAARIDAMLATGRHAELIPELERLVAEHPFEERLRSQHMLALYRSGRQVDALESYQAARRALDEDLGLEPGQALQQLQVAILQQDSVLRAAGWRPPGTTMAGQAPANVDPGPTGPRGSARRIRLGVSVTGMLIVIAVGAAVFRTIPNGAGPAPSTSATTGLSGSAPSSSPLASGLNIDEQKLSAQLPLALVDVCVPGSSAVGDVASVASLSCDLPPIAEADEVLFDRFSSLSLMNSSFSDIAQRSGAPNGECSATVPSAVGDWKVPDVHHGRLLCYAEAVDDSVWIVWTYEADLVLARARRGGSDSSALFRWWRNTARFLG